MRSDNKSYIDLEEDLKGQPFRFREASIIDLTFFYLWPLIGFYSGGKTGSYFDQQTSVDIDLRYIQKQDIISDRVKVPAVDRSITSTKRALIFRSDRTQAVIDAMRSDQYILDSDTSLVHPKNADLRITEDEFQEIGDLVGSTIHILGQHQMVLTSFDQEFFKNMVIKVVLDYLRVYLRLALNLDKISLIVTHADNHPPFIFWIVAAKILRVPTMMIQHGLDCEPYFLDDTYADYIAVWSEQRRERYLQRSRSLPREIRVTGNPNYDDLVLSTRKNVADKVIKIAYIGRPHHIEKTYFHFRNDRQARMIFDDLYWASQTYREVEFICKLHPYDDKKLFEEMVRTRHGHAIKMTYQSIYELFEEVDAVIAEDSTGAVEAVMYSKPLLLLHYEQSDPIVRPDFYGIGPVVKDSHRFKTAFKEMLGALKDEKSLSSQKQEAMLTDYVGRLDGGSTMRVITFIEDILGARKEKREEITICSVVSKDHLQYADALYKSLRREDGDVSYKVLVIDDDGVLDHAFGFEVVSLSDLHVPMIDHMVIYYDAFELSCALKPFFIEHLFKRGVEKVVFLDSDIFISGDLYELSRMLDRDKVIFTPHYNVSPPLDGLYPDDPQIALFGVLNGGFWAMRRSSEANRVLEWFMRQMTVYGFHEPAKGMTGDQPMIAVAAILFDDITILRKPQYNIAYWNMHERDITYRNGRFYTDGEESVFFHLSRFRANRSDRFTIDEGHRVTTESYPVTKDIIDVYLRYIGIANDAFEQERYGFEKWMGKHLDKSARREYFDVVRSKVFDFLDRAQGFNILFLADGKFWEMDNGSKARLVSVVNYLKTAYDVKILFLGSIKAHEWEKIEELSLEKNTVGLLDMEKSFLTKYEKDVPAIYDPILRYYRDKNITDCFYTYVKTHHIDVCVVEYLRWTHLTEYLDKETVTILDMHDVMYRRCEKLTEQGISHWIDITKDQEFALFERFDHIMAIQTEELKELKENGFTNVIYTPYAIDIKIQAVNHKVKKVTYVAGKNEVNDQAILWFLENVWIYFIQIYEDVRLHVYGTVCETLREYSHYNLELHGKVDDLDEAYFNTDIVVNPIHVGGGLKIKSVEALSNALPLITTKEGAGGMEDGVDHAFLVVDDADEFLSMLIAVSESEELRQKMADRAYDYAVENFSLDKSYEGLCKVLKASHAQVST